MDCCMLDTDTMEPLGQTDRQTGWLALLLWDDSSVESHEIDLAGGRGADTGKENLSEKEREREREEEMKTDLGSSVMISAGRHFPIVLSS